MVKTSLLKKGLVALGLTAAAASSHAALILDNPQVVDLNGTGLGAVNTVLTIESPANTSNEAGSVSWNGSTTTTTGNVTGNGNAAVQNQAVTLGSNGFTTSANLAADLANLRIIFNAAEPGNGDNGITLGNLALTFFSPTGTSLYSTGTTGANNFSATQNGIGKAGYVFKLDGESITAATAALSGANFSLNDRIGLAASASNATGGPETFFTVRFQNGSTGGGGGGGAGVPVPEPATLAMLGLGIGALGIARRRKR
jgi:hypothetical protein